MICSMVYCIAGEHDTCLSMAENDLLQNKDKMGGKSLNGGQLCVTKLQKKRFIFVLLLTYMFFHIKLRLSMSLWRSNILKK